LNKDNQSPMPCFRSVRTSLFLKWALASVFCGAVSVMAQSTQNLPASVQAALLKQKIPLDAVSVLVTEVGRASTPRLAWQTEVVRNPASVMKLLTTFMALDQLGPAFTWVTPVFVDGVVKDGKLNGNVYIQGQGDPKLVVERLWLLMRRLQGLGIQHIAGDIVLDRSAFELTDTNPADFDGEGLRPYNAQPDALLLNFKSLVLSLTPDTQRQIATVQMDPPMAGVAVPSSVALVNGPCDDWRGKLKADFADPLKIKFAGSYANTCGERVWPVAYADPARFAARAVLGMWQTMGGTLSGQVREGKVPSGLTARFSQPSLALADLVRDINKYSNNVMAQQLFLSLSLGNAASNNADTSPRKAASFAVSRQRVQDWWTDRFGPRELPVVVNGSGLSRQERISAQALNGLLQYIWASPLMPELMSSLPVVGIDGTLRRFKGEAQGQAHLKSGSLRDVSALAGFVHAASGKRYVLVAMVNHANAPAARPALDALVQWAVFDQSPS
jgi:serine-type D-Ala-D-Ala carboxypeptidase/endopeptidase (penicillin-binding protein 4)